MTKHATARLAGLLLLSLLAACTPAATTSTSRPAAAPAAPARPAQASGTNAATTSAPAQEQTPVLGQTPEAVLARFGTASLDRTEAATRHLQFGGSPCILDIYFYPETDGAPATARHMEARLLDGTDANAADCVARRLRDIAEERAGS